MLELLVAGRELPTRDSSVHERKIRLAPPKSQTFLADGPTTQKNLNIDPARFPAYAWRMPRRIKVHSVIGNDSGSLGWKIHDWIAVGTQFTRWCEHGEGGGEKGRRCYRYNFDIPFLNGWRRANDP
jgi:hypothetical protein